MVLEESGGERVRIAILRDEAVPVYRQIEAHFRQSILAGALPPGTRLPASRRLAADLGVSRITVESAYAELEAAGLVQPRQGSGTFVLPAYSLAPPLSPPGAWPNWQQQVSADSASLEQTPAELLRAGGHPQPISFAEGGGDPHLFPAEEFRKVVQSVLRTDSSAALDYGDHRGLPTLRETIAGVLASQGLQTRAENILITSGSQQAISLVSLLLLQPGDSVVVEAPTYGRALDLFRLRGLKLIAVPVDEDGLRVDLLADCLRQTHPKLIYVIPNFQNPSGACLSSQRRRQLLALAAAHDIPVLEDDFVGDLRYEGNAQPALKALDDGGRVIYISTFSKMLLPGLRVGFVVADGPVYQGLARQKQLHDLASSNLLQHALNSYVTIGRYQAHLRRSCRLYRERRDCMSEMLRRYLPESVTWQTPSGGLFFWLRLPAGISAHRLLPLACKLGVSFAPGESFFPDSSLGESHLRLNFAAQPPAAIAEGVRRLGQALHAML